MPDPGSSHASATFLTTRWNLIAAAGQGSSPDARRALADLCAEYWYPLYAYVRRRGLQAAEAQDVTQAFFAELLEKDRLQLADQQRGRFRSFLLASMHHFLANTWRQAGALKRGGGVQHLSLDFAVGEQQYGREPEHHWTPERVFERRWALTLLHKALSRLQQEYTAAGKADLFDALKGYLGGDEERQPYEELSRALGMTQNALKVTSHRLRKRFAELLRAEIAETVATPDEIDDELRDLWEAVAAD